MDSQLPLIASPDEAASFLERITDFLLVWLRSRAEQPGPAEVLAAVERRFGWPARHELVAAVGTLREDRRLEQYQREYLRSTLDDAALAEALRGSARWTHEDHATLDELFRRSAAYQTSNAFQEMIAFTAKFRDYAPFNNLLVRLQNPSCAFYATEADWRKRFHRCPKLDARPMLILAPKHPVLLVYDLDSTEADPAWPEQSILPEQLRDFAAVDGELKPEALSNLLASAKRDHIKVEFVKLSSTHAGRASTRVESPAWKMRVVIHEGLDEKSRLAILAHELAHIYLGHLGGDADGWWPSRINLSHATVEIEAEATAYILSLRLGLKPSSAQYVSGYLKDGAVPPSVSSEMIVKTASKLEAMARRVLPERKAVGEATV